jgi:hypothetical protein
MVRQFTRLIGALLWLFMRNWVTVLGSGLTTISFLAIVTLVTMEVTEVIASPYLGIVAFLVLPGFFILGLILIPIGALWQRHAEKKYGEESVSADAYLLPRIDFNNPRTQRLAIMVALLTLTNLFVIGATTYKSVVYMESVEFCGEVCHTVMKPEFTAYKHSPHSRVECVECHIGPGAPWFVRSKLSGAGQLFAVTFDSYQRPIPTPVENLRPSRDTCEQCHWPERFTGDRVRVINRFMEDEANTPVNTVLLMHIGGGTESAGGIHSWHIAPGRETTYLPVDPETGEPDPTRRKIAMVRVKEADGTVTEYKADGFEPTPEQLQKQEFRVMDCIDCHNRPSHTFELPFQAVDKALASGAIDPTLPYIRAKAVEVLESIEVDNSDLERIEQGLQNHFRETFGSDYEANADRVAKSIEEVKAIYSRNVFPDMDVTWGDYPNNLGHLADRVQYEGFEGCNRCHDGGHSTADGVIVNNDCTLCHSVLAMEEEDPQILIDLGIR